MTYIRLTYKNERSEWFNKDDRDSMRMWLYCDTDFSCYEAMCHHFGMDGERNDGLGKFLGWLDDDVYDGICNAFFEDVIMDALESDGAFRGITIEEADEDEIKDELEKQAETWY